MPEDQDAQKLSRAELERQVDELKRERIQAAEHIKRLDANQKRADEWAARRAASPEKSKDEPGSPNGSSKRKREKDDDKDSDKDSDDDKDKEKSKDKDKDSDSEDSTKKRRRREKDKEGSKRPARSDPRSKALFGKLLGHLQSAKSRLETEKGWKSSELQKKAQEKTEQKLELQKLGIQEMKKAQYVQSKKDEEEKIKLIDKTIAEKEVLLLQRRLESHYSAMMNFIRTKAEPTIFYLPKKHTKETKEMLEETQAAIKHKIATLETQLEPVPQEELDARASAAAAAAAAAEGDAMRDENDEEPSIPRDAPQNAAEAEAAEAKKDNEDSDDDDEKADKAEKDKADDAEEKTKDDKEGSDKDDAKEKAAEEKKSGSDAEGGASED